MFLATVTWLYIIWSIVPVLIAIQFSFNSGRSRSTWQGFSFRWWWGDPDRSLWHDESLREAMVNSLTLAGLTMLIATPLGVALAIGLSRWRGPVARGSNLLMLVPLSTPEIVMGAMLFLVFDNLYTSIPLGRPAMILGHVTFSISYVVVDRAGPAAHDRARSRGGRPGPRRDADAGAAHRRCCRCSARPSSPA